MAIKVLVFESDPSFAETLRTGLLKYGCEVSVVDDANGGLAAASRDKPDLILLAIELPHMNGFLHIVITIVLSCLAGALWGAIAGVL